MKFLLNMNMPRELGRQLAAKGHEWRHVRDIAMARASDVAILEEARKSQDVVVTHDLDYGHLCLLRRTGTLRHHFPCAEHSP